MAFVLCPLVLAVAASLLAVLLIVGVLATLGPSDSLAAIGEWSAEDVGVKFDVQTDTRLRGRFSHQAGVLAFDSTPTNVSVYHSLAEDSREMHHILSSSKNRN